MIPLFERIARFFSADIAMDLGTANTLLFTKKHGIVINEPSVVALDNRTGGIAAIGARAKQYLGRTPDRIRAVRPLKDGVIADFDITRAMIGNFIKRAMTGLSIVRPGMVICVPSGITQVEKRAVIEAARLVGARSVSLVEEPMAAALGADLPVHEPVGNIVLDIGGGTSEVAVISLNGVAASRSLRVAGDAMNLAIQRYLRDVFHLEVGENTAENIKILLGSACPQPNAPTLEVSGKDVARGCPLTITITEGHVREALSDSLKAILNVLLHTLEKTPPELGADISRNGLLLAGGGSLLKGLDQFLSRETRLKVFLDSDPLTTVLRGTAKTMLNRVKYEPIFIN